MEKNSDKQSFKEKRIRETAFAYYSMPEIKKALFEFSKNRECIPRYYEIFGKRPDSFQYENDIFEYVKRGATSFHCSEELWRDPLEISTELSKNEIDELRIGWDLLLDIDSKYLEYSKIYASLVVEALKLHGVENIGVKFSGSKGMHIIVPWRAFPEEIYNQKTKDMFPEWPRIICEYLSEIVKSKLEEEILKNESIKEISEKIGKKEEELIITECRVCKRNSVKKFLITWNCSYCKKDFTNIEGTYNNRKKPKCPDCRKDLIEKKREEIYYCEFCNKNSKNNPEQFEKKERFATEKFIDADLILVSPRHLYRMPYSLHEKTALSSVVIDKDEIKNFQMKNAKPFNIKIKNFYPTAKKEEAKLLLLQALDWKEQKEEQNKKESPKTDSKNKKDNNEFFYKRILFQNINENFFPPCIKLLLNGIKSDGRKRALFILINFFKSLGATEEEIERKINEWNEKNYQPLKKGYIRSQLNWYRKNISILPPNCDKPNYKELNVCKPDEICKKIKNPINYPFKKFFQNKSKA